MYTIETTQYFSDWLLKLKDRKARSKIAIHLSRMEDGLLGDHKSIGDKLSEIRIDYGPGYRLYYTMRNNVIILLLIGGDKSSQSRDIAKAKLLLKEEAKND